MKIKELFKEHTQLIGILVYVLVSVFIIIGTYIILDEQYGSEQKALTASLEPRVIGSYFKEPMVIEKEVVVYVEVEKQPRIIEEPIVVEHNIQPINGYFDIFTPTNFTYEDMYKALDDSSHSGLLHLAEAFVDAEQIYGVNSLYLMSTIGFESGWGKYHSGYNNLGGWKNADGTWRDFDSEYDCIMTVAEGLSTSFREDVGGSLSAVTSRYCPDPGYMDMLMQIMEEQQNKIIY